MSRFFCEARNVVVATSLLAMLTAPFIARAGTLVDQGAPGNQGAWKVTSTSSTPVFVNPAAQTAGATTEVLVTNAAGGTSVPTTPLANRRAIEIQNLGPNAIYCTVDGTAPVVLKARSIAANGGSWALDIGPNIVVKCIAASAAQLTTAATIVTEVS